MFILFDQGRPLPSFGSDIPRCVSDSELPGRGDVSRSTKAIAVTYTARRVPRSVVPPAHSSLIEIVASMTSDAGDVVVRETPEPDDSADLAGYLRAYADRQLTVVLTPRLMQLRRLVIGEVSRFPDLAKVLYERGPQRALARLTAVFERLAARGLLTIADPSVAASHFNWLIMADPLNRAMLLGDDAIPAAAALRRHVAEGVRVFLAAYGTPPSSKRQVKGARRSRARSRA